MIRLIRFAFALAVLLMALGLLQAAAPMAFAQRGGVIDFASGDPEMAAAIATARASLPEFWSRNGAPLAGEDGFALKVAVSVGPKHNEHIWVGNVVRGRRTAASAAGPRTSRATSRARRPAMPSPSPRRRCRIGCSCGAARSSARRRYGGC